MKAAGIQTRSSHLPEKLREISLFKDYQDAY